MSKTAAYPVSETKVDFSSTFYVNAVKSSIRKCLINQKANSCPMAVRLAWHASGTHSGSASQRWWCHAARSSSSALSESRSTPHQRQ